MLFIRKRVASSSHHRWKPSEVSGPSQSVGSTGNMTPLRILEITSFLSTLGSGRKVKETHSVFRFSLEVEGHL